MTDKKRGRKSKYETNVKPRLLEIAAWCRDGLTDEEIADIKVENSLNRNANGYDYEEQVVVMKKEVIYNEQGKRQKEITYPVTVTVTKHKEAETKAQQFWLQNRKPDKWRNQAQVELKVSKLEDILNGNNS